MTSFLDNIKPVCVEIAPALFSRPRGKSRVGALIRSHMNGLMPLKQWPRAPKQYQLMTSKRIICLRELLHFCLAILCHSDSTVEGIFWWNGCYYSLQIGVTYNVDKAPEDNSFDFLLEVVRETKYEIEVKACSQWNDKNQNSGMAVMDVGIPSGFELDWDTVDKVTMSTKLNSLWFALLPEKIM